MSISIVQSNQTEVSSSTSCTCTLSGVKAGNTVLCAFVHRTAFSGISDGWTLLGGSDTPVTSSRGTTQYLKFAYINVNSDSDISITVNTSTSGRIYVILMEFSGVKSLALRNDYMEYTNASSSLTQTIGKNDGEIIVWGSHTIQYLSGGLQAVSPSDLIKINGSSSDERLACFFDDGTGEKIHTFTTCTSDSTCQCQINAVQLFDDFTTKKYLIRDGATYYNVVDGALNEITVTDLTAQVFTDSGMDNVPSGDLLTSLTEPEVLMWCNDDTAEINVSATVTATPFPQSVERTITMNHESITGIENATATVEGSPIFSCSFDGGTTYEAHNGTDWVTVDSSGGMSKVQLESISTDQWNAKISGLTDFIMRFVLQDAGDTVTQIKINFTN